MDPVPETELAGKIRRWGLSGRVQEVALGRSKVKPIGGAKLVIRGRRNAGSKDNLQA